MPGNSSATEYAAGDRICFAYEHQYRVVDVERVWTSKDGNELITGVDPDKGEYRSFRIDRIQRGKVRVIQRGGVQESRGAVPGQTEG